MKEFMHILSAELMKLKRSIAIKLVFLIPILLILLMIGTLITRHPELYNEKTFYSMLQSVQVSWLILVLPMFLAIETGIISSNEQVTGQWKHIFCLPVPRENILLAKWMVELLLFVVSQTILNLLFYVSFPLLDRLMPNIDFTFFMSMNDYLQLYGLILLSCIGIVSLHFIFALLVPGLIPSIAFGIAAVTISMGVTWGDAGINWYPWTLPIVAVSRYLPMEFDTYVPNALIISPICAVLCLAICIPLFVRKDVF